jgi:3-hydroxybutyrate dehydrogenase
MSRPLDGKCALITGSVRGLGLAAAHQLAEAGCHIVFNGIADASEVQFVRDEVERRYHVRTLYCRADLRRPSEIEAMVAAATDALGAIDILINNAVVRHAAPIEAFETAAWDEGLAVNLSAAFHTIRLVVGGMKQRRWGRIINVSSIYGRATGPLTGWYQAAKHALEAVSDALRIEVAGDGVKVVLVEPGGFRTNIWADLERDVEARAGSRFEDAYKRTQQLTRLSAPIMGEPRQCARLIARLLDHPHPRTRYLVGYDAQALAVAERLAPTGIKDRVLRMALGL